MLQTSNAVAMAIMVERKRNAYGVRKIIRDCERRVHPGPAKGALGGDGPVVAGNNAARAFA